MVTNTTSVADAFGALSPSRFLYVIRERAICGLVTYSDFDKRPVRLLLYTLIGEIEHDLIEIIKKQQKNDDYWLSKLSEHSKGEVTKWHEKRQKQNVNLRPIDCFSLGDTLEALKDESKLRRALGLPGNPQYSDFEKQVVESSK